MRRLLSLLLGRVRHLFEIVLTTSTPEGEGINLPSEPPTPFVWSLRTIFHVVLIGRCVIVRRTI
jgi:hypothetical protein